MTDLCLRFTDQTAATAVLYTAVQVQAKKEITLTQYLVQGELDHNGDVENYSTFELPEDAVILDSWPVTTEIDDPNNTTFEYTPNFANISIIGVIYKPTGKTLQGEDGPYPEMAAIEGWHVNVRVVDEHAESLEPFVVVPVSPVRVWG